VSRCGSRWTPDLFYQHISGPDRTAADGPFSFGRKRSWVEIPSPNSNLQVNEIAWIHIFAGTGTPPRPIEERSSRS
jgi:hypothetical protein